MTLAKELLGAGFSPGQATAMGGGTNSALAALGGGSTNADAAPLVVGNVIVTGADGTKGVVLPLSQGGEEVLVFNNSGSTLKVWPPTGASITVAGTGVGTTNAAFSHLTFKMCQYNSFSATQWTVIVTA